MTHINPYKLTNSFNFTLFEEKHRTLHELNFRVHINGLWSCFRSKHDFNASNNIYILIKLNVYQPLCCGKKINNRSIRYTQLFLRSSDKIQNCASGTINKRKRKPVPGFALWIQMEMLKRKIHKMKLRKTANYACKHSRGT